MKARMNELVEWLHDWCESCTKWEKGMSVDNDRLVWLSCYGVPPNLWNRKNFQKIGEVWGDVVEIDEDTVTMDSLKYGRLRIWTSHLERIDKSVILDCQGSFYPIWVFEECNYGVGSKLHQGTSSEKQSLKRSVGNSTREEQSVAYCHRNMEEGNDMACTAAEVEAQDEVALNI
ncbi:hypothetical protein ACSBR2_003221 [Camellia fascicularis]